jgi:tetratricopeptide (TPR) repeat protein
VDNSLLQQEEGAPEAPRFRMLETVREYGIEQLTESGELDAIRRGHAQFFLTFAEEAAGRLPGPDEREWLDRVERDLDNLRAARAWTVETRTAEWGLRLGGALGEFWCVRGYWSEGRERLAELHITYSLMYLGNISGMQGDREKARALLEGSLAIRRELGDQSEIARLLLELANALPIQGEPESARTLLEESLMIWRELRLQRGIAWSLFHLGDAMWDQGDRLAARSLYEQSLAIFREVGDLPGIAQSLLHLGEVAQQEREYEQAAVFYEEELAIRREIGDRERIAGSLDRLGLLAWDQGDHPRAAALFAQSLRLHRELGHTGRVVACLEAMAGEAGAARTPGEECAYSDL